MRRTTPGLLVILLLGCGGSTAASHPTSPSYPVGCVVTTTMESTYCGPVTCNCGPSFGVVDGGLTWTCAL